MKWKTSLVAIALFLLFAITSQAQGALGTMEAYNAAGTGMAAVGSGLVVTHLSQPIDSPASRMAARRAAYNEAQQQVTLAPDSHAVEKHGADANVAYQETADITDQDVETFHCKVGRDRTVNWRTKAIRVKKNGETVTAFHYESRHYLQKSLDRDGCIEEPTLPVGHDNVRQVPSWPRLGVAPTGTGGPQKARTPTALEIAMARRKAGALK